ncbi:MAG: ATP-binding cassette domain-containing protein [Eggerthellaceae bacterium]|nr:ATP-binding cassette domain-containing protein [Eggerthellaceae bacterium]
MLELQGIMKEYDGETVLAGVDLNVEPGQVACIVGPSGCGKSTLLSVAGLLLTPSAGDVLLDGASCLAGTTDAQQSGLRLRAFGFVFQHSQLVGSLRAIDNVLMPGCFGGSDMQACAERATGLIERLQVAHRVNHFPHQLSVGQKRRFALARALVQAPRFLIADEPTNDLDLASARLVMAEISRFCKEGGAVLAATHDHMMMELATHVYRLEGGKLSPVSKEDALKGLV